MSISHIAEHRVICPQLRDTLRRLEHQLAALLFERALGAVFNAAQCEVLGDALQRQDLNAAKVQIDKRLHNRVLHSEKTYHSAAGPVTVKRTLYRAGKGDKAISVLESRVGARPMDAPSGSPRGDVGRALDATRERNGVTRTRSDGAFEKQLGPTGEEFIGSRGSAPRTL